VIITSAGTAVVEIFRETRIDKNCFTYKKKTGRSQETEGVDIQKYQKAEKDDKREETHDDKEIATLL
jgi:hypothetical protein